MKLVAIAALTADGKIGIDSTHFPDWTEPADKKMFMTQSLKAGVLIMGSKTFDSIGKPLPGRKHIVLTRNTNRRSQWDHVIFTQDPPTKILRDLEKEGYSTVVLAGGARVYYLFAKEGLIDELIITYSPKVFGVGLSLFSDPIEMDLRLEECRQIGQQTINIKW
ncbi:MAG: dihydrofolate reductase [Deltaproteobacteria bacterium]|nr:dihydrofolate reductase [Deltaproteobacteria bacterium]